MSKIYQISLTGLPSSGKGSIGKILGMQEGFHYLENDDIRNKVIKKSPFELNVDEWALLYSEVNSRKHLYQNDGESVVTDGCPFTNDQKRTVLQISPVLSERLEKEKIELARYLVQLDVDPEIVMERNIERGRKGPNNTQIIFNFMDCWEMPENLDDDQGPVKVLRYQNNDFTDHYHILSDLSDRLDIDFVSLAYDSFYT